MKVGHSHVSVQPNIDDLMCAGMSSGPAEITQIQHQPSIRDDRNADRKFMLFIRTKG